jgi:hypothetical protein
MFHPTKMQILDQCGIYCGMQVDDSSDKNAGFGSYVESLIRTEKRRAGNAPKSMHQ